MSAGHMVVSDMDSKYLNYVTLESSECEMLRAAPRPSMRRLKEKKHMAVPLLPRLHAFVLFLVQWAKGTGDPQN